MEFLEIVFYYENTNINWPVILAGEFPYFAPREIILTNTSINI